MFRKAVLAALFAAGLLLALVDSGSSRPPCWAKHGVCPTTSTVTTTVTTETTTSGTTTAPVPSPGGWGLIQLGGTLGNVSAEHQQAAQMVVVTQGDAYAAAALPGRSLVYMNALKVRYDGGSGVSWDEASSLGYLTGVATPGYPATFARIDSAAYQQWFAQKAIQLAQQYGLDGIFLDDVAAYSSGSPYTIDQEKAALLALTQTVGAALRSAGLYLLVNANGYEPGQSGSDDGSRDLSWWEQLAPSVGGVMTECWQQARDGSLILRLRGTDDYRKFWDQWQTAASQFHADWPGVAFVGLTYGDDAALTYGRASLMLADSAGIFLGHRLDDTDPYGPWISDGYPTVDPVAGTATIN